MGSESIEWPTKSYDIRNAVFDSTLWNDLEYRNDDIVVASWAKSGTTWVQQIVGQLIFNGAEAVPVERISPWYECILVPHVNIKKSIKAQTHRRFLKTHLPLDALTFSPKAKYLYCGRDGRDVAWSLHHHHSNFTAQFYDQVNANLVSEAELSQRFLPATADVVGYFREWLAGDGYPFWPFWGHIRSWWNARHLPNLMFLHFAELKRDMPEQIRRIARFLDIPIDERRWPAIVEHCTFDYMKQNAQHVAPFGGALWEGGASTFMHRGTNGCWRDLLTTEDVRAYEERSERELGEECARWLATGKLGGALT